MVTGILATEGGVVNMPYRVAGEGGWTLGRDPLGGV